MLYNEYKQGLLPYILHVRSRHSKQLCFAVFMFYGALFKFLAIDFPSKLTQFIKTSDIRQLCFNYINFSFTPFKLYKFSLLIQICIVVM